MANSFVRYTGNNSTTSYSIPFSYRATSDLTVTLSGVVTTAYTLNSAGTTLTFNTAPAQDVAIEIRRRTSQGTKLVDYASGSVLTENDLDTDSDQAFFMSQEAIDDAGDVIKVSNTNFQWDTQNKRLTNVADPVDNTDAVNKQFISNNIPNINTVAGISSDVTDVANIASDVTAVANDATDIGTVATNMPSVTTVATNINDVITVANDLNEAISEIETAANDLNEATSEIDTVSNNIANVNIVGTNIADVTTVANNETDIQTLADLQDGTVATNAISTLAGLNTEIQGVYNIRTNVTNVDTNATNVNLVAGQISPTNNISAVGAVTSEISTLGALGTEITNLNNIRTDITGVNNIAGDVTAVNNNSANITAVNNNETNINAVSNNETNINTVASNIPSINSFANTYRIGATDPTTSLDEGDLFYNSSANALKYYNGTSWVTIVAGSLTDIIQDGTPQLGGDLDLNNNNITGTGGIPSANLTGTIADARLPSITNAKLAGSIANDKLVNNSITINGSPVVLGGSVTVGETKPTISSISPDTIDNTEATITITGANFVSVPQVEFLNPSTGIWYTASTVTFNNSTSLTVTITLSVDATYKIRIENPDGNAVISSTNILTVSDAPTWTTSAGSLGTFAGDTSGTLATVVATSDSAVTFSEVGSNLATANVTLSSGGVLSTTDFGGSSTTATTYNFTIRATDAEGQTADRSFSLTSSFGATGGGQFN